MEITSFAAERIFLGAMKDIYTKTQNFSVIFENNKQHFSSQNLFFFPVDYPSYYLHLVPDGMTSRKRSLAAGYCLKWRQRCSNFELSGRRISN